MYIKIRIYHYSSFQPKNAPKAFGGRALPGPARGAYSAPPDLLAGFKTGNRDKGRKKRERHEGIDS